MFTEGKYHFFRVNARNDGGAGKATQAFGVLGAHQMAVAGVLIPELALGGNFKPLFYTLMGFLFWHL
jgi:hypothetical protein